MTAEQLPAALTALGIHGITEAKPISKAKHIFSHIEWRMTGYTVTVEAQPAPDGCIWATREQLQTEYTLPGAFKAYKKRLGLVLENFRVLVVIFSGNGYNEFNSDGCTGTSMYGGCCG